MFENTFEDWGAQADALLQATQSYDHEKLALMLHSVPPMSSGDTESTLERLLTVGHKVWLTGTSNYTELDSHFPIFVDCLDALVR